jgi:hypothetical protein
MKFSDFAQSAYFKAADFATPRVLTIQSAAPETLPDGKVKLALLFAGEQKKLVLNATNGATLCQLYGENVEACFGKPIECYAEKTTGPSGGIVDGIRLRQPQQPAQQAEQPAIWGQ